MADLEISVAATGAKQATDDLARLANKTEAAAQANAKLAASQVKVAQAATQQAKAVGQSLNRQAVQQAQAQAAAVAASTPAGMTLPRRGSAVAQEGRFAKVVGRLGGGLGPVGGLSEIANLGPSLGAAAAGAVIAGSAIKILGAVMDEAAKKSLLNADAQLNSAKIIAQAQSIRNNAGVEAFKSQGQNIVQLAGLGQTAKEVAAQFATKAWGGAADAQQATITAYRAPGVAGDPDALVRVLNQAVELATLEGLTLKDATSKIIEAGGVQIGGKEAIAIAASEIEQRVITTSMIVDRQARIAGDFQSQQVMAGTRAQGTLDMAGQVNLGQAAAVLNGQAFEVSHPEMALTNKIWSEASVKMDALVTALGEQGPLARLLLNAGLYPGKVNIKQMIRDQQDADFASGIDRVPSY